MYCYARTDPRMRTFDGVSWTASLIGEFVMYRDIRRQIAVSIRKKHVFPDYDKEHMAGVTGQQRMLDPQWHLILPLIFLEGSCLLCSCSVFSFGLLILNNVCYHHMSFKSSCFESFQTYSIRSLFLHKHIL